MQQLIDLMGGAGGQAALGPIAQRVGLTPEQTQAAMQALLPALAGGMKKQVQAGNADALQHPRSATIVDRPEALGGDEAIQHGNAVLGQLFGSKDVSRTVASHASQQTGIGADKLKLLLPILATLATGAMAKQAGGAGGGLGGLLGGLAGAATGGTAAPQPRRAGGLAGMLDLDGDGNPLDDIMGMAGKVIGGRR
jgi:hypothetical protein